MNFRSCRAHRGFTLIEALVVLTMVGVLLALAAPSFVTFTSSQKVKTASFDLYAALLFARSEAIKRRQCVTVAPTLTTDWTGGWTVSTGGTPTGCSAVATPPLRTQDGLTGVTMLIPPSVGSVVYRMDGRLASSNAPVGVLVQPQTSDPAIANRCIRVDQTGLPKTITGACP